MIPIFSNSLGEKELEAVKRVFQSKWLGRGEECKDFCSELAHFWYCNAEDILLTDCCTNAFMVALRACGIGPGDEVIVPTIHFVGVANAIMQVGAKPVFVDVDKKDLNILPEQIRLHRNDKTKAVVLLHYGGKAAPIEDICNAAGGLKIISDEANSISSYYGKFHTGLYSDIAVYSFDSMKQLVTGDGGAILCKDKDLMNKCKEWAYLGMPANQASGTDSAKDGNKRWWEFDVTVPGTRHISNDIMAAIGRVQLDKLPLQIETRLAVWKHYCEEFQQLPIKIPDVPARGTHSCYLYRIETDNRDKLAEYLKKQGVYTTFRYYPLHKIQLYDQYSRKFPNAEWANERSLCLPVHQNITGEDAELITTLVRKFYGY